MEVAKPIIRKIDDTPESLKIFEEDLCSCSDENVQEIVTSYPTVYIHNWKESLLKQQSFLSAFSGVMIISIFNM